MAEKIIISGADVGDDFVQDEPGAKDNKDYAEPATKKPAAKKKPATKSPKAEPGLKELPPQAVEGQEEAAVRSATWRVSLHCPTPLAHPTLDVTATNEEEAKAEFCRRNGISGSVHNWTVERLS